MRRSPGWPVVLRAGEVWLRPIQYADIPAWRELQQRNRSWLRRWEATIPPTSRYSRRMTPRQMIRAMRREAAEGRMMPFVVMLDEPDGTSHVVGQLTVAGIAWGSLCAANVGYWIDERWAGRGVIPTAVALVIDHCFRTVGLHRVEVCIRPDNRPSRRVAEKLGLRCEGTRPAYLHIDGGWRDHVVYAMTSDEAPEGLLTRLLPAASAES